MAFPPPAANLGRSQASLLEAAEVGREGQLGDIGGTAPVGAKATRILRRDTRWAECRALIAGEHVTLRLGQIGVVVAQVEREGLVGEAEAGIPVPIAGVLKASAAATIASCTAELKVIGTKL